MMKAIMRYLLSGLTLIWCGHLVAQSTAHDCNAGQLISIIGKNNYEKARRGQPVNPREFVESSQKAIVAMEKEVAEVQKLLTALGVQSTAQAQATIVGYQAQLEGSVGSHELEATIKSTAERIVEKKVLLQEMDQALKESDSTLREFEAKQKMPIQTCDALYKARAQEYAKVIGQQNSEAINAAVEQKIANPTIVQHPDQLLKLAFFPPDSSVTLQVKKAKEELDQQVRAAKEKLEKLNQALRAKRERSVTNEPPQTPAVVPASLLMPPSMPNSGVVMPMLPEPSMPPVPTSIPPAPPLPKSVTPSQKSNQPGSVPTPQPTPSPVVQGTVEPPASTQTPIVLPEPEPAKQEPILVSPVVAPTSTPNVITDCEKKLIKIRMALNAWSNPDSWFGFGAWYNEYLKPIVENKELSPDIKKRIGLSDNKSAELTKLPDCEKTLATINLVQKCYENDKKAADKDQTVYNDLIERYIEPVLKDIEWSKSRGLRIAVGGVSDYDHIRDYNSKALSDPRKNTFGITKEEYEAIFGKQ